MGVVSSDDADTLQRSELLMCSRAPCLPLDNFFRIGRMIVIELSLSQNRVRYIPERILHCKFAPKW